MLRALFCTILASAYLIAYCKAALSPNLKKLEWMVGTWRGEHQGKTRWPTIPTMTYGEELIVQEAPVAAEVGINFFNYTARSWAFSTQDQLHDEWGYLGVDDNGIATLMTTGNNGFNKIEEGRAQQGLLTLDLSEIGRISFSRDLPVENLRRTFRLVDDMHMEQILDMTTETHPKPKHQKRLLEHARIIYKKVA